MLMMPSKEYNQPRLICLVLKALTANYQVIYAGIGSFGKWE